MRASWPVLQNSSQLEMALLAYLRAHMQSRSGREIRQQLGVTDEEFARRWQRPWSSVISVQQPEPSVKVSLTARSRVTLTEDPGRTRSQ